MQWEDVHGMSCYLQLHDSDCRIMQCRLNNNKLYNKDKIREFYFTFCFLDPYTHVVVVAIYVLCKKTIGQRCLLTLLLLILLIF